MNTYLLDMYKSLYEDQQIAIVKCEQFYYINMCAVPMNIKNKIKKIIVGKRTEK